jgi:Methyltransferase domain
MRRDLLVVGACCAVGLAFGVVGELLVPRFGVIIGALAGLSSAVVVVYRRTRQMQRLSERHVERLSESLRQALRSSARAEAMALVAPKDDYPALPWTEWALGPEAIQRFIAGLRLRDLAIVVECGSGISTVLIARELAARGSGHVYAIEDDVEWASLVRDMIAERGLSEWADVVTAPLEEINCDGMRFVWYSRRGIELILSLSRIDALLVDGPKGPTGPLARYPALPTFNGQLGPEHLIVLDDARRTDETRIAKLWEQRYGKQFCFIDSLVGQWEFASPRGIGANVAIDSGASGSTSALPASRESMPPSKR